MTARERMTEADYKAERMVDLLLRVTRGARLSTAEMAEHYGCSQRTAQRLVLSLSKDDWVALLTAEGGEA